MGVEVGTHILYYIMKRIIRNSMRKTLHIKQVIWAYITCYGLTMSKYTNTVVNKTLFTVWSTVLLTDGIQYRQFHKTGHKHKFRYFLKLGLVHALKLVEYKATSWYTNHSGRINKCKVSTRQLQGWCSVLIFTNPTYFHTEGFFLCFGRL